MSDTDSQITLRETIAQAVEENEPEQQVEQQQEQAQDQEPSASLERARDEAGKFAKQTQQEPIEQQAQTIKPRPSSWKKDYEEHWTKLDPTLQDYINQREQDYAKGVSTYKQNWDQAAPIYEAMQPFMPLLQQHNIAPQQWISNLGNAHKTLASGSADEKLQMFAKLANDYGVPLGALTGQQHDPQFSLLSQELNQIKNQWSQFQTEREKQAQHELQTQISSFQEKAPYFEQVRETMAGLLQSGMAQDLQTAYDKAIRLNDDVWQCFFII